MKKQLMTGALALTMMMGSAGMAMAADVETAVPAATVVPAQAMNVAQEGHQDLNFSVKDMKPFTAEEYAAQITETKAELAKQVAAGELKQAEADAILADMNKTLSGIKDGTMKMFHMSMVDENGKDVGNVCVMSTVDLTDTATDGNMNIATEKDGVVMTSVTITQK